MNPSDQEEYIRYRIESAWKTLEAAKILADGGFWNSSMNRLYYSAFYAVNALLVSNKIFSKSHSGTKSSFSQHFIKTGKLPIEDGRLFSELFDNRQKGDYDHIFDLEESSVLPLFQPVKSLIERIEEEIRIAPK